MTPEPPQLQAATLPGAADGPGFRTSTARSAQLSRSDLEAILAVTRALAAPFDLPTLLAEVTAAARRVLRAERSSVWLHEAASSELVMEVSSDIPRVRIPLSRGLAGACARDRVTINVPDCYADARFDTSVDRSTGFRTRSSLTLPLIDHHGELIGVMQVLNKQDDRGEGVFGPDDEALAEALAAQCAVALSRARMTAAALEGEKLRQELELARSVQLNTLPRSLPVVPGYDMHATFLPAAQTGGDTYDLALVDTGLLVVLGDATGHGIAPALSVTQMQAMLRMALRLGADLETAFTHVNDRLAETLADDRFITAFVGLLDGRAHRLRFLSGGQGPILHFRAQARTCDVLGPTGLPLGAMPLPQPPKPVERVMAPGDWLLLLSDGIFETQAPGGALFGEQRVIELLQAHHGETPQQLSVRLLEAVRAFAQGAPQDDDITMVLLRRLPDGAVGQ